MKRASFLAFFALLIPGIALAAAPRTFSELAQLIVEILNSTAVVLIAAGLAVYLYGVSINVLNIGGESKSKVRTLILWGIIVLFVMVSLWGILRLLQDTIFGSNPYSTGSSDSGGDSGGGSFTSPNFSDFD